MPEITRKPLSWFKISPQVRKDLGSEVELRNLGESLRQRQLAPVGAMTDGELIFGFRRLKAAFLAGLPDLAVTIFTERLSVADIKMIQLTENIHRLDMKAYDKWKAYEELRLLNPTWTAKDLADHLRLDPPSVTKWLSPSKCIAAWQEALRSGQVGITDCYNASQAPRDEQQSLLELKLSGATRDTLSRAVRRNKPKQADQSTRSTRITIPLACGTKVVISGTKLSLADVVEKLGDCMDAARKGLKDRLDARTWQNVMRDKAQAVKGETNV